ncbi:hypothetical protein [Clostridium chrysemydis]|uniref:hypothetical protein n=1 Tax=Clostridium chrysemydis TaxID=2665504 RepID=UPI0018842DBA|nr:hypothetical protein [Clostridium chrysemydis]
MKKLDNRSDSFKITVIYVISTIATMILAQFIVKYGYIKSELKNYLWVVVFFTVLFLALIKLFKVKYKSILLFLGIIMFFLIFILINIDIFVSIGSTPDAGLFPILTFIAIYTTLPFQCIIITLVGYDLWELSYVIVPIYIALLALFSYLIARNENKSL